MNNFLVSAGNILNDIQNRINQIAQAVKTGITTPGGNIGPASLTSSVGNLLKGLAGGGTFYESGKQTPFPETSAEENVYVPPAISTVTPGSAQTKAPTATAVPVSAIVSQAPAKVGAPSVSMTDIGAQLGRLQSELSGLSQTLQELSRTQAPAPSATREASGALPPPPAPRGISRAFATTGENPPVSPALTRVPLSEVLRAISPERKAGSYVGLPETRVIESRPRRKLLEELQTQTR